MVSVTEANTNNMNVTVSDISMPADVGAVACVKAKAFIIDYLAKLPEVKDTVHKHSLLHHLTNMILDQFPDASDLYSDIGAITRCAKV